MRSMTVVLDTVEKVKSIVEMLATYEGEFTIKGGRYVVDAKSIMGIFSLDLSKPLELDIDDRYDESDELITKLQEFKSKFETE